MKSSFFLLSLTALTFASVIPHPAAAQVVTAPEQVQSGTYDVEPSHTQVGFSVLHFGFTNYQGVFSDVSGTLDLNDKNPAASHLSVSIPVGSVQTTSAKLTEELKGDQWFNAAQYPNATFESTSVHRTGKPDATVIGHLTLHGLTTPETLKVHFIGARVNALDQHYTAGL